MMMMKMMMRSMLMIMILTSSPCRSFIITHQQRLRPTSLDASSTTTSEKGPVTFPDDFNRVEIEYCTGCRWMLRAAWIAQELLTTFQEDLDEVAIQPASKEKSGTFDIRVNGQLIWCRKKEGRFPEAKEVKQRIRDVVQPDKDLGHSDVATIIKQANDNR